MTAKNSLPSWTVGTCPCKLYFRPEIIDSFDDEGNPIQTAELRFDFAHFIDADKCKLHATVTGRDYWDNLIVHHQTYNGLKQFKLIPQEFQEGNLEDNKRLARILNRQDVLTAISNYENAQKASKAEHKRIRDLV